MNRPVDIAQRPQVALQSYLDSLLHEATEALEQLRALWHGFRIAVHVSELRPGPGVDTPEDLVRVRALIERA